MGNNPTHFETFWGDAILDTGYMMIPNLLSRNLKKLGITHAEFVLICNILSHKHDTRDPFPSQETLAAYQDVTTRQIRKLIYSLREDKKLLRTGRRRNVATGEYVAGTAFSFRPLLDKLSAIAGQSLKEQDYGIEIEWDDEVSPQEQEVPQVQEQEVPQVQEQEVPTKIKKENKKIKSGRERGNAVASLPDEMVNPSLEKEILSLEMEYDLMVKIIDNRFGKRTVNEIDYEAVWRHWQERFPQFDLTHIYALVRAVHNSANLVKDDLTAIIITRLPHAQKSLVPIKREAIAYISALKEEYKQKTA